MSRQPEKSDFIVVKVHDDGDIVLYKVSEKDPDLLCYSVNNLEVLHDELLSYGVPEKICTTSILKAVFNEYREEVYI